MDPSEAIAAELADIGTHVCAHHPDRRATVKTQAEILTFDLSTKTGGRRVLGSPKYLCAACFGRATPQP